MQAWSGYWEADHPKQGQGKEKPFRFGKVRCQNDIIFLLFSGQQNPVLTFIAQPHKQG